MKSISDPDNRRSCLVERKSFALYFMPINVFWPSITDFHEAVYKVKTGRWFKLKKQNFAVQVLSGNLTEVQKHTQ
jgi:hypothetical protein